MTELFTNNRRVFDALERKVTPYAWDTEVAPASPRSARPAIASATRRLSSLRRQERLCAVRRLQQFCGVRAATRTGRVSSTRTAQGRGDAARVYDMLVGGAAAGAGLSLPVSGAGADRKGGRWLSCGADEFALDFGEGRHDPLVHCRTGCVCRDRRLGAIAHRARRLSREYDRRLRQLPQPAWRRSEIVRRRANVLQHPGLHRQRQ